MKPLAIWVADPCELFRDGLKYLLRRPRFSLENTGATLAELLENSLADLQPSIIVFGSSSEPDFELLLKSMREGAFAPAARLVLLVPEGELIASPHRLAFVMDAILPKNMPSEALAHFLHIVSLGQKVFLSRPGGCAPEGGLGPSANGQKNAPKSTGGHGLEAVVKTHASCTMETSMITANSPQPSSPNGSLPAHQLAAVNGYQTSLSVREWEILEGLKLGKPNKAIARYLNITESTVKVHVKSLLKKIRVNNRTQAALWASAAQLDMPQHPAGLLRVPYSAAKLGIPLGNGDSKPTERGAGIG